MGFFNTKAAEAKAAIQSGNTTRAAQIIAEACLEGTTSSDPWREGLKSLAEAGAENQRNS